jgi:hypothetical protein
MCCWQFTGFLGKQNNTKGQHKNRNSCQEMLLERKFGKWNAKTCLSIDNYEAGLIEGILPLSEHAYTKRRSCGDNVCELVISFNGRN